MRRRKITVFSLSFLDCISCGLGAVILLFVIVNARGALRRNEVTTDLRSQVSRLEKEMLEGKKGLIDLRNTLDKTLAELVKTQGLSIEVAKKVQENQTELAHYERQTLASKAHINRLKADLKSIEEDLKRLEGGSKAHDDYGSKLRRFVGQGDRQYITDLKVGGDRIFILVDASASMLDETIVGIIRRRHLSDEAKLKSPKWQQAVATVDWLTTQLPPSAKFQVYTFNETAVPVLDSSEGVWLDAADVGKLNETVGRLRKVVPQKGTSLLNAFNALRKMNPPPDNIFLLVDSLPTMGAGKPLKNRISGKERLSLFERAIHKIPVGVPLNIILYPMEGDPMAASAFWRLAKDTGGSFFSPSRDWP
jgi:hypothetical protein